MATRLRGALTRRPSSVTRRPLTGIDYPARWGLVESWGLDNAAGAVNLVGDHAGLTLTNTNGVTLAADQKLGSGAAQFTAASSQQLSSSDARLATGGGEWWLALWVWLDTLATTHMLVSKSTSSGITGREYSLAASNTNTRFTLVVGDAAGAANTTANGAIGSASAGAWYLCLIWRDAASDLVGLRLNHGTAVTVSTAGRVPPSTAGPMRLGMLGASTQPHNGRIDGVAFGKDPPGGIAGLIDEISARLYAEGAGRLYPWST